jgi:hypothetical protein
MRNALRSSLAHALQGCRTWMAIIFALHKPTARRLLALDIFHLEVLILRSLRGSSRSPQNDPPTVKSSLAHLSLASLPYPPTFP